MNRLITKSGKEIRCDVAEVSPTMHILYLVLPDMGIVEAAALVCNDAETAEMIFIPDDNSEQRVFRNFTILVDIVPEVYGTRIGMRQPYMDEVAINGD